MHKLLFVLFMCFILEVCSEAMKPNIVLIVTDDQDSVLGGITPMKNTREIIGKHGVTFSNSFTTAPICCPSRASILTGLYPHNHNTINNTINGGCSSVHWQKHFETKSFATHLQKSGYKTFYAGKYLNDYGKEAVGGPAHVPPGWSEWRGLIGNSKYYNFTLSHNGIPKDYNNEEYLTDVISDEATSFLKDMDLEKGPFLMVLAPPAPHQPFEAAPRHKGIFNNTKAPRTPNFNILKDKERHWFLKKFSSPLTEESIKIIDKAYQDRWETLLSVDEMVKAVVDTLTQKKHLENTFLIFTSDNGYHLGQFGLPLDKRLPYETDIRVPLMIRGPGILENQISNQPVINIDLAPTILKIAGLIPPQEMDGTVIPLFDLLEDAKRYEPSTTTNAVFTEELYDRQMLIEYTGESSDGRKSACPIGHDRNLFMCQPEFSCKCQDAKNNTYTCIRHLHPAINILYCSFNDHQHFEEAYDLSEDRYQETNCVRDLLPGIRFEYRDHLQVLKNCKGSSCTQYDNDN